MLMPEPQLDEDHILMSNRHVKLGGVRRLFYPNAKMNLVYDWVGSLEFYPMYFELSHQPGIVIQPSDMVSYNTADAVTAVIRDSHSSSPSVSPIIASLNIHPKFLPCPVCGIQKQITGIEQHAGA